MLRGVDVDHSGERLEQSIGRRLFMVGIRNMVLEMFVKYLERTEAELFCFEYWSGGESLWPCICGIYFIVKGVVSRF